MKRRARPEQKLQMSVADYLRVALRPPTIWTTFPSGGGGKLRGAILKGAGLVRGWPDILVLHPAPACTAVVGLELKAPTGRPSEAQAAMEREFRRAHAAYEFCWSIDDVQHALEGNGIPLHARVGANGRLWGQAEAKDEQGRGD